MVLGFNHNIRYKGELFHVQTEDSGRANPHIITLLYRGGTIIASAKTSYADIIKVDQLEAVVESIMKDQHKEMMRRLKGGEFDARIFPGQAAPVSPAAAAAEPATPGTQSAAPAVQQPPARPAQPAPQAPQAAPAPQAAAAPRPQPAPAASASSAESAASVASAAPREATPPKPTAPPAPPAKRSLDEVILDYLITGEE